MCDLHDQETTLGGRAPSPGTFVSRGRIEHTSGGVGLSQKSSTRPTEDRDMDDVARGVVLFPSRSSPRPWAGLCPLPTIREESASEDEDERESVGSRALGTETDVLSDTVPVVLRRIHRYKTWELHRGSWDPLMTSRLLEQGRVHRELATLSTLFLDCHQSMDHKKVLKWLLGRVRRRVLPTWLMTKLNVSSASMEPKTKRA